MVLDTQRQKLDWWLVPLAKALRNVNPNTFTWLSLIAAFVGGYAFYASGPTADSIGMLILAWAMVLANSVLDLLDGKVAKITGQETAKGDYLDHAIDRFSDSLFMGSIALSPWVDTRLGMAALVFTLLTSYLGTQGQAVGMKRNYGGLLGRADRMVLLLVVPLVQVWAVNGPGWANVEVAGLNMSLMAWMLAYVAVVGAITTVQRFVWGLKAFDKDGSLPPQ